MMIGKNVKSVLFQMGVASLCFVGWGEVPPSYGQTRDVDYSLWDSILEEYVDEEGMVDYQRLKNNRETFDEFIEQVETADVDAMDPREEKAFWINAYNAITMKVILDRYPVRDIRFINFGFVWKVRRDVAGQTLSLGHIEHNILRPMGDPRIHFAINCASMGCPVLRREAYRGETLDEQLEDDARRFINNPDKVRLDHEDNRLYYSAIFHWFKEDFLEEADSVTGYIKSYLSAGDQAYLDANEVDTDVLDYDWNINKQR